MPGANSNFPQALVDFHHSGHCLTEDPLTDHWLVLMFLISAGLQELRCNYGLVIAAYNVGLSIAKEYRQLPTE